MPTLNRGYRTLEGEGYTPFPHLLIDKVMPSMSANAWRALCLIIRKTIGFQKEFDEIPKSQFKDGMGVGNNAVDDAIRELQGFRTHRDKKTRCITSTERIEAWPEYIVVGGGGRLPDGKQEACYYGINPILLRGLGFSTESSKEKANKNSLLIREERGTGRTQAGYMSSAYKGEPYDFSKVEPDPFDDEPVDPGPPVSRLTDDFSDEDFDTDPFGDNP